MTLYPANLCRFFLLPVLFAALCATGCRTFEDGTTPRKDDAFIFFEGQKALDAKDYTAAIDFFQMFMQKYPESEHYSWALQRLGESFEGLLDFEYHLSVKNGEPEKAARKRFLERFEQYRCWNDANGALAYDGSHYQRVLKEYPESPIADEAAYKLTPWEKEFTGKPNGPLREFNYLEQVLEKYPTTSFRFEILYKMARRGHLLFEIYTYAPDMRLRDSDWAEQFRVKALYLYKLALKDPRHTKYSQKSWAGLRALEDGKRIFQLQ